METGVVLKVSGALIQVKKTVKDLTQQEEAQQN